ncbi:MAG: nucleoside recognition domain-containing protein [Chitinophagales bacterium]
MALNYIWISFFVISFFVAIVKTILGDTEVFSLVTTKLFESTKIGFEISLGLTALMAFWLGIMNIADKSGLIKKSSNLLAPFFSKLFPEVPKESPAYGNMMMNFSANMLGLDNAATPLGLKAMNDLQNLNHQKTVASKAMIMFLVINTAGITLIPTSVMAIRQTMAIEQGLVGFNAADIFLPTLMVTYCTLFFAIIAVAWYQKLNLLNIPFIAFNLFFIGIIAGMYFWIKQFPQEAIAGKIALIGSILIFGIIVVIIISGAIKKINVYDTFIDGAKDGFKTAVQIIPYLIAILAAIAVFNATGCLNFITDGIGNIVRLLGFDDKFIPALPVGLMKTLSGSGARAFMVDLMHNYGVNSFQGNLASIMQGSTETTFYVLAVYFGSVGIKNAKSAVIFGLLADIVGIVIAIAVGYLFYG